MEAAISTMTVMMISWLVNMEQSIFGMVRPLAWVVIVHHMGTAGIRIEEQSNSCSALPRHMPGM